MGMFWIEQANSRVQSKVNGTNPDAHAEGVCEEKVESERSLLLPRILQLRLVFAPPQLLPGKIVN